MNQRILVTYASKAGSTGEVAAAIGQVLAANGATVDVYSIEAVPNIQDYQAIIVGSAIRAGKWLATATRFVETHQPYLSRIPTSHQSEHRALFLARFLTGPVITTSCAISLELW